MSRIKNAQKNISYAIIGNVFSLILQFVSRTVFIYAIGVTYLGVRGLYTNILSVLSLTELGFGTAMIYSLYKPVADDNKEKIKSLLNLYKKAFRWIALIITVIGLLIVPFLRYIVKEPGEITQNQLIIFYLIFLFNTVSTYFISYKYNLVNAHQKRYIITNSNTLLVAATTIFQILSLVLFKSFLIYLLIALFTQLIHKIIMNKYINKKYPYILEKDITPLSDDEKKPIKRNIKALVYHKVGDISIHQTDNILISSFINVTTVGLLSNYLLIITSVTSFLNIAFQSVIAGFGNLIATENKERQYFLFKVYRFVAFWLYGFASIAFIILLSPFIELWIGPEMVLMSAVIYLIIIDYYFKGHRVVINNFKSAAGIFNADKYIAIIQAIVNLSVSIIMVRLIGLPGIFVGTVIQGLISTFVRPFIVYHKAFNKSAVEYFKDSIYYLIIVLIPFSILYYLSHFIFMEVNIVNFIILTILVAIIPNILFILFTFKRKEFRYLSNILLTRFKGVLKR